MSLNGGYAMIKYNSTQEELAVAYKSKRPALFYDENQRAHWAVIEETATESVDEETQEPITTYAYSYKLLDEASAVVANPTLSGNEATLNGLEVDGTKYKVGGGSGEKKYEHVIYIHDNSLGKMSLGLKTSNSNPFTAVTFLLYLHSIGYTQPNSAIPCCSCEMGNSAKFVATGIYCQDHTPNNIVIGITKIQLVNGELYAGAGSKSASNITLTDKVTEV